MLLFQWGVIMVSVKPLVLKLYPVSEPLPQIKIFDTFIQLWDKKRGGNLMPQRDDFSFRDLKGWHSRISICEYIDGIDLRIVLAGEEWLEAYKGFGWKGMLMSEMDYFDNAGLLRFYREVREQPAFGYFTGRLPIAGRGHVTIDSLDLPIRNAAGDVAFKFSLINLHT